MKLHSRLVTKEKTYLIHRRENIYTTANEPREHLSSFNNQPFYSLSSLRPRHNRRWLTKTDAIIRCNKLITLLLAPRDLRTRLTQLNRILGRTNSGCGLALAPGNDCVGVTQVEAILWLFKLDAAGLAPDDFRVGGREHDVVGVDGRLVGTGFLVLAPDDFGRGRRNVDDVWVGDFSGDAPAPGDF